MLSLAFSAAMLGIEGYVVRVEADSSAGSPHFAIIGLADRALNEARGRVRSAIFNSGFAYPAGNLLVNLSPADVRGSIKYGIARCILIQVAQYAIQRAPKVEEPRIVKVSPTRGDLGPGASLVIRLISSASSRSPGTRSPWHPSSCGW